MFSRQKDHGGFIPVIEGSVVSGTQTYSGSTAAWYVRTGDPVTCNMRFTLTNLDVVTSGDIYITGLPYAS